MASTGDSNSYSKVIAHAWADDGYKQSLINDPVTVLTEAGVTLPVEVEVRVVEDTTSVLYLVIPNAPGDGEISEDDLGQVSGGTSSGFCMSNWP